MTFLNKIKHCFRKTLITKCIYFIKINKTLYITGNYVNTSFKMSKSSCYNIFINYQKNKIPSYLIKRFPNKIDKKTIFFTKTTL